VTTIDLIAWHHEHMRLRGLQFKLRKDGQLHLWPRRAWWDGLTDAERDVIKQHRVEFTALQQAGLLPDTDVVWDGTSEPRTEARTDEATTEAAPRADAPSPCPGCGRVPCIGPSHWAFAVMHPNDPAVIKAQQDRYRAEMVESFWRERLR
jgi:hypothetical protein